MKANDMAAMREALRRIKGLFRDIDLTIDCPENEAYAIAAKALAAPPRNCDVGTAEEQGARLLASFEKWREDAAKNRMRVVDAVLNWAQMPYKEGDNA